MRLKLNLIRYFFIYDTGLMHFVLLIVISSINSPKYSYTPRSKNIYIFGVCINKIHMIYTTLKTFHKLLR